MTVASSSSRSPRSPGTNRPRAFVGTSLATAAAQSLSVSRTCLGMSSSMIRVPLGTILNLIEDLGGGQHVGDPALFDGRVNDLLIGAVVEIDRDPCPRARRRDWPRRPARSEGPSARYDGPRPRSATGPVPGPGRAGTCRHKSAWLPYYPSWRSSRDGPAPSGRTPMRATATHPAAEATRGAADGLGWGPVSRGLATLELIRPAPDLDPSQ